jgi:GNAT superfamily N-acetyltransferase
MRIVVAGGRLMDDVGLPPLQESIAAEPAYRLATRDDAHCIGVLATQVFLDTYATSGIRTGIAREVTELMSTAAIAALLANPDRRFVVADLDRHLLGFVQLHLRCGSDAPAADAAKVERLYVQERFAARGIGSVLLARAEALAAREGMQRIWLTVWAGNDRALAFYPRRGYRDTGPATYTFEGESYENRMFAKMLARGAGSA